MLAARGESLAAFDGRCIPAGGVAPPSNTPGILGRRALPSGRLARLGATPDFHHGLLDTGYDEMVGKIVVRTGFQSCGATLSGSCRATLSGSPFGEAEILALRSCVRHRCPAPASGLN